jgi:hypothetical protein
VAADVRPDIKRDKPCSHDPAILPQGLWFEPPSQIDRKINALAKVEFPDDVAASKNADIPFANKASCGSNNAGN